MVKLWLGSFSTQLLGFKSSLIKSVMGCMLSEQVSIITSMVFGDQTTLQANISHDLKVTGMQHVVSASGTNVGLIIQPVLFFSRHFPALRQLRPLVVLCLIWSYLIMTGGNPPILRAVLMATYKLGCELCQRQYQPGFALGLAALVMLGFRPLYLGELSFQLSIGASIGIITLLPLLDKHHQGNLVAELDSLSSSQPNQISQPITQLVSDAFYCTLAAQLMITPILFLHELPVSVISLVTNSLLLWLVPIITFLGIAMMLTASVAKMGIFFVWLAIPPLRFILSAALAIFVASLSFWGKWEVGLVTLPKSWFLAVTWWGLIFIWIRLQKKRKGHDDEIN